MPEGHGRPTQPIAPAARDAERDRMFAAPPQHFYRTAALPCPYVQGRVERKLVTGLAGRDATQFYNALSRAGFRRSHNLAYRPACAGCTACLPVRIPVADFAISRSLRRIRNLNRDLAVRVAAPWPRQPIGAGARRRGGAAAPALCLSRLSHRGEPEDGLQGAVPAARGVAAGGLAPRHRIRLRRLCRASTVGGRIFFCARVRNDKKWTTRLPCKRASRLRRRTAPG